MEINIINLTVAAAYMEITNEALARNAETSVLVHKTKLMEKELENLKKYEEEMSELKAEGEELKAQGERNRTHKKLRAYYKERHQNYSPERQRMYHTFLIKTELKDKIDTMMSGYIIKKSSNETYDNIFSNYPKDKPITNVLLRSEKSPKNA